MEGLLSVSREKTPHQNWESTNITRHYQTPKLQMIHHQAQICDGQWCLQFNTNNNELRRQFTTKEKNVFVKDTFSWFWHILWTVMNSAKSSPLYKVNGKLEIGFRDIGQFLYDAQHYKFIFAKYNTTTPPMSKTPSWIEIGDEKKNYFFDTSFMEKIKRNLNNWCWVFMLFLTYLERKYIIDFIR